MCPLVVQSLSHFHLLQNGKGKSSGYDFPLQQLQVFTPYSLSTKNNKMIFATEVPLFNVYVILKFHWNKMGSWKVIQKPFMQVRVISPPSQRLCTIWGRPHHIQPTCCSGNYRIRPRGGQAKGICICSLVLGYYWAAALCCWILANLLNHTIPWSAPYWKMNLHKNTTKQSARATKFHTLVLLETC